MAIQNLYNYKKPKSFTRPVIAVNEKQKRETRVSSLAGNKTFEEKQGDKYLEQKVLSAKPEELTLMLYEGIIKFIGQAKVFVAVGNVEKSNAAIQRAQLIIDELAATLDMEFEFSENLAQLYDFVNERLFDANMKKDAKILEEALEIAVELRDLWKDIMKAAR